VSSVSGNPGKPAPPPGPGRESWAAVYRALLQRAARLMENERTGHTLQPTALVHEAFLRLSGGPGGAGLEGERLVRAGTLAMRRVLLDHARRKGAKKRTAAPEMDAAEDLGLRDEPTLLALGEALEKLEALDPELARVVESRFFGALTFEETARELGISVITAKRRWKLARGWLHREIFGAE